MNVIVFGLGAIGSNVMDQLSRKYGTTINLIGVDYDKIEERNIKTQIYFLEHVGYPKSQAIIIPLQRKSRNTNYVAFNRRITDIEDVLRIFEDIKFSAEDLILDCFDNNKSRQILVNLKRRNTLHIGFSPQYAAEIIWNDQYSVPEDIDPKEQDICDVSEAVPFIGFVTSFATLVISNFIDKDIKESYIITNKVNIKKLA
ncbi:MAG TPA: ThiF family adenylyltransferase [Methanofastidiosum sp.]|nr:ThiF family adenylyltransferase [Methanofastidiosum sp.]